MIIVSPTVVTESELPHAQVPGLEDVQKDDMNAGPPQLSAR